MLRLQPSHIVTTNYDNLFEQVVLKNRALYSTIRQNSDLPKSAFSNYLIKMHGCFSTENIVLTEDDYLNYSVNFSLIEGFIKGLFSSKIILFIGFSFDDINLKYILERVNNILGAGKQQHFIFFNEQKSQIEKEYFELKGLNPIFYDDIEGNTIDLNENIDLNPEGRKLYLFLKILEKLDTTKYKLEKTPILNQIEESLSQFLDMDFIMPELYNKLFPFNTDDRQSPRLKKVFRRDSPLNLDIANSQILELFNWISISETSSSEKMIGNNIRSFDKLKEFRDDINDDFIKELTHGILKSTYEYQIFEGLVTVLNNSFIYYLNNQNIIIDRKKSDCNCISCCFERFDFKSVIEIIYRKEIKKNDYPSNCSIVKAYLIKGYFAHKFGLRDKAYESFKNAQNEAFIVNNEVIRFISAYNLKNFKSGLFSDYLNNDYHNKEQQNLNLEEILDSLNLSEIVKEELQKILREIYIIEIGDLLRVRKGNFEEKKHLHDNGGMSSGGNDLEMNDVSGFRLLRFYENNYLVDTEYSVLSNLAETTLETSLLSFMVKKIDNVQQQRIWPNDNILNNFDEYHLHLFIHYSQKSWHKKKIKIILNGRLIKLSDKAKLKLKENFKTFLNSYFQVIFGNEIVSENYSIKISSDFTFKIFNNFLELITLTDFNDEYINEIADDIVNFLLVINFPNWAEEKALKDFFRSKGNLFSSNQLIQLIEIFIKKGITHYIKELVDHITDSDQKLGVSIEDLAVFFKDKTYSYIKALGYIHSVANKEVQLKIRQHLEEKLINSFDSITFLQLFEYNCFDKEKLTEKYIEEEKSLLKENYPQENSVSLNNFLQFISRNYHSPNIQKLAKEPNKNTYVDWLLNYDTFDYKYFKLEWFNYFITQLYIKFMKQNNEVKKQLREFLLVNKEVELQNQYSRLYLEVFETID